MGEAVAGPRSGQRSLGQVGLDVASTHRSLRMPAPGAGILLREHSAIAPASPAPPPLSQPCGRAIHSQVDVRAAGEADDRGDRQGDCCFGGGCGRLFGDPGRRGARGREGRRASGVRRSPGVGLSAQPQWSAKAAGRRRHAASRSGQRGFASPRRDLQPFRRRRLASRQPPADAGRGCAWPQARPQRLRLLPLSERPRQARERVIGGSFRRLHRSADGSLPQRRAPRGAAGDAVAAVDGGGRRARLARRGRQRR